MAYTVKRITMDNLDQRFLDYVYSKALVIKEIGHNRRYNIDNLPFKSLVEHQVVFGCFKGEEPVGYIVGVLNRLIFDPSLIQLIQVSLSADYPKATAMLLVNFIDFGKRNANYIVSSITVGTNIKPSSLEGLGFTKLETQYRMEV